MSTFRPVQVPQQPRTFFTPGTAAGSSVPYLWQQQAALFRSREEVQQPRMFAPQPPANAFVPALPLQMPRPDRADIAMLLNEPPFTPGTALGVPPPRTMDQTTAYWRTPSAPPQISTMITSAPPTFVPALRFQTLPAPSRAETALQQILPLVTPAIALGVPPPRSQDLQVAYRRDTISPLQPATFAVQSPAAARVPPVIIVVHAPISYRMDAQWAALRRYVVPPAVVVSQVPPAKAWEQAAAYRVSVTFPQQPWSQFIPNSIEPPSITGGRARTRVIYKVERVALIAHQDRSTLIRRRDRSH